ncbi:polyphosphate kinase 2, PA0141 family [Devosia lucknowensis]|uniref:ADP/GDP-polyphosphate phosphotransferase n=1 Tax=Devosia lucknowensis TaxID=1096929 RepID=A0A1Y6GA03_9HYPH|nr:polyphosphate kinase 2 [Devosia lucknowensis]SMQ85257.1 polyphosphate kinase 2, PA0141 family [Devosia lucknowensis]
MTDPIESFDINDPELPKAIRKAAFGSGGFPYDTKLDDDEYDTQMYALQKQLVLHQAHMANAGSRTIILFEGRDAAGKGGTIERFLENLNRRYNFSVALPKPSDREATQWYFQRYVDWLPAAGEMVLFDRSWYNRAVVEPVMGFCTPEQTEHFLEEAPEFEKRLTRDGIRVFKFWLSIGREMQLKRFHDRRHDPLKGWKLSPVDLKALTKWDEYSAARDRMLKRTDSDHAPWTVIRANDKNRLRLNAIRTVLHGLDYEGKDEREIGAIDRKIVMSADEFEKVRGE